MIALMFLPNDKDNHHLLNKQNQSLFDREANLIGVSKRRGKEKDESSKR